MCFHEQSALSHMRTCASINVHTKILALTPSPTVQAPHQTTIMLLCPTPPILRLQGHTLLACISRTLRCLAQAGPLAVIVTNHLVAQRGGAPSGAAAALPGNWSAPFCGVHLCVHLFVCVDTWENQRGGEEDSEGNHILTVGAGLGAGE